MAPARPPHPLLDAGGTDPDGVPWSLTETRAPVVHLTPGRANLLGTAARSGHRLVLASDELSGLTPALAQVWLAAGAYWLVRDTYGGLRDGFTGRALAETSDLWRRSGPVDFGDVAPAHLLVRPAGSLVVTATVALQHPARAETLLGSAVELTSSLARTAPALSYGPHEPAGSRWDRAAFTRWFAERMPEQVAQVAASASSTSLTWVARTSTGLHEVTEATVDAGPVASTSGLQARVADVLGRLAETTMPRAAVVTARAGTPDLLIPPFVRPAPLPVAVLVGPPLLRELGLDPAGLAGQLGGRLVGRTKLPAVLVELPAGLDAAWDAFRVVDQTTGVVDALSRTAPVARLSPPAAPSAAPPLDG